MKGPVLAPQQQEMIMENRIALSPRNTASSENADVRNASMKGSTRRSSVVDPWSDSSPSSPVGSPIGSGSPTISIPQLVPTDIVPAPRTAQKSNSNNGLINAPPREIVGSRASSKATTETNTSEPQVSIPPRSPSPGRKHRFKELPVVQNTNTSQKERPKEASGLLPLPTISGTTVQRPSTRVRDPIEQEQALFEQRLCEDAYGVAVRKINQYGKANLRYVKCVHVDDLNDASSSKRSLSSRSASSKGRKKAYHASDARRDPQTEKGRHVLVWGKKKDIQITLDHFTAVRIGKCTERARRNPSPPSRILSLLTNDPKHPALDIEAPTRMDRDKFARAFARFLDVPLEGEDSHSVHSAEFTPVTYKTTPEASASSSAPGDFATPDMARAEAAPDNESRKMEEVVPVTASEQKNKDIGGFWQGAVAAANAPSYQSASNHTDPNDGLNLKAVVELPSEKESAEEDKDNDSVVSSLTGHGYDQELVEELHNALNDLRVELEDSRAEAARAVKVAEQAIQSAEKTTSQEWHNTVTHKAAEAAAQAQKRSAEAMAKQRLAEERLENERRTAAFWRKHAEVAEEEAGFLQTRAAAAEVRKSAIEEQLEGERCMSQTRMDTMKARINRLETSQLQALDVALRKNRELELELDSARRELAKSKDRHEDFGIGQTPRAGPFRKKPSPGGKMKAKKSPESSPSKASPESKVSSSPEQPSNDSYNIGERVHSDQISKLKTETVLVRQQYELLRKTTTAELSLLPEISRELTDHVSGTLDASQAEIDRLRGRLAMESASRRKLLTEVQDLRGIVRVYCRPRPSTKGEDSIFSMPSQETLVLRRDTSDAKRKRQPMSFEFDRIFEPTLPQQDVYSEVQEVCLGVLDGFNITVMAFGPKGCGKTRTILGEISSGDGKVAVTEHGIQLQALQQLFTIAEHRTERFKDTFSLSIVEVHDERLSDLLVGTSSGDGKGHMIVADSSSTRRKSQKHKQAEDDASSGRAAKLEIRSDLHGETVVQGALTVELGSFDEVVRVWVECISNRRKRLEELEIDIDGYEAASHVIATVKVTSANIATGHGVVGKLQFVDMAAAELTQHSGEEGKESESISALGDGLRFTNRSLETLGDVAVARSQFVRSVPYRNSTLTHLLRDSLEGDTKVLFLACVSSDQSDVQEASATLRLASRMRQVSIGKATRHSLTSP